MKKYLVSIHRPRDYDPHISEDAEMSRNIDALNDEMRAAGVRLFAGGLQPISTATSIERKPNGEMLVRDGTYLNTNEYVDGFWILETSTEKEVLQWANKAAIACKASVEVRPFH